MKLKNPNPTCDKECRFTKGAQFTTLAFHQPLYDKNGDLITNENNIVSGRVDCIVCGGHWTYITSHGVTTYTSSHEDGIKN
jgi:hypothetical protein